MTRTAHTSAESAATPAPEPERISGGHRVAKALKAEGIETLARFSLPFVGIVGKNSSMSQLRYGRTRTYGADRVGNTLGGARFERFAEILGGHGESTRDPADIGPALLRAGESGKPALINVSVDPEVHAPGTMNQTMYK